MPLATERRSSLAPTAISRPGWPAAGRRELEASRGIRFSALPSAPTGVAGALKRVLDLSVALALIALLLPLAAVIALCIRLESRGPVFISQDRVGLGLGGFRMVKFRSMVAGADRMLQDVAHLNEARGALFKIRSDPRLTRVGRLLRRTSLDEIPQLLNVVAGQMSLVGPRPPFAWEVENDPVRQSIRLRFRPGMTGLWQVSGRSLLTYDEMVRLDLQYTRTWSFGLDLAILARTLPAVLSGRGAF